MRRPVLWLLAVATLAFATISPALAANDPYFSEQWGLEKVGAEPAWGIARGAGVWIAVVDSGVKAGHPDLAGKLLPGWDFAAGDELPDDENGHGTLVAGVAAAAGGNGEGIAGVAPDAQILPVRAFDAEGDADSQKVADGIRWAADHAEAWKAKLVLNLSFVGTPDDSSVSDVVMADPAVGDAVHYASSRGAAVVAAAGNSGAADGGYNAPDGSGILVVGSSTRSDACSAFSNYGPGIDILAPGSGIVTTDWEKSTGKPVYSYASGTSMSVPFVSGAVAVLMSRGLSAGEATARILETARGPKVSCRGEPTAYGFLDVAAAAAGIPAEIELPALSASPPELPSPPQQLVGPAPEANATPPATEPDVAPPAVPVPAPGFLAPEPGQIVFSRSVPDDPWTFSVEAETSPASGPVSAENPASWGAAAALMACCYGLGKVLSRIGRALTTTARAGKRLPG